MAEVSWLSRLEPRPRDNDLRRSLAAEVRDPLWFLFRQWQMGEFQGEDTGSLAYIKYTGSTAPIPRWATTGAPPEQEQALDRRAPLEPQTLREPFEPDLGLQVELGQDFSDLLRARVGNDTTTNAILDVFRAAQTYKIEQLQDTDELDPVDPATKRFLRVCAGRSLNGFALYQLGVSDGPLPAGLPAGQATNIQNALTDLVARANEVFGQIGQGDPLNWQKERLEYQLQVVGVNPAGQGNVRLDAHPDGDGEYDWFSFDARTKNTVATEATPRSVSFSMVPARVQFDGMPAPRFWNFEDNHLALPDITSERDDLVKMMTADFMMVHSNDWYVIPYAQPVGTLARTQYILVRDVFGKLTVVHRADADATAAGTDRWTMFSTTDFSGATESLTDYFILPPSSGPAMQLGSVLEDVRFGRDETANMAFGIERITQSPIGEPRSGRERDAQIDARRKLPTPAATTDFALKYRIESEIPANWIPLLPIFENPNTSNPSIVLQRGAAVKATSTGSGEVQSLSNILNPLPKSDPYFIKEEEIPRSGLRVERVVFRTRWIDGTSHLWVQRRRRIGAGESSSGLTFDQPLPNTR
jgi:hypothetical protein